jgi:predicted DNA-binding protein (MmcQ/YjbR family)
MNIEDLRNFCLSLDGTSEHFPFDDVTLVMKVGGKMFALISLDGPLSVNLKCNPEKALELRDRYQSVLPGYHMSKTHWNTIMIDGSLPDELIKQWIKDSYWLIISSLPKKIQAQFNSLKT